MQINLGAALMAIFVVVVQLFYAGMHSGSEPTRAYQSAGTTFLQSEPPPDLQINGEPLLIYDLASWAEWPSSATTEAPALQYSAKNLSEKTIEYLIANKTIQPQQADF